MKSKKIMLLISLIAITIFFLLISINVYETFQIAEKRELEQPFFMFRLRMPIYSLFIFSTSLIIFAIFLSYYIISKRLEEKIEKKFRVISKFIAKDKSNKISFNDEKQTILKFLNPSERKVIEALIKKNGEIFQSEITKMQGMTKLKTHRAVKELEKKGIINRKVYGKTYKIFLEDDVKDILLKF
jgi:uncharacterized membrane protein